MAEVGFKRNAARQFIMKRLLVAGLSNVYAVKLNDEVVVHAWRE